MNTYYPNSHTQNPILTDRQKALNEENQRQLKLSIERLQLKKEPFVKDLAKLEKELSDRKQYISTAQIRVHRKRVSRLKQEIQSIDIQIQMLEK